MKEFKKMKKFGAAVTVAAMLGSLSVGVFADEVDPETVEVPEVPAVEESVLPEVPVVEEEPAAAPEEEAPAEEEPAEEDEIVTLAGEDEGELVSGADPAHAIQITEAKATLDEAKNLYTVILKYQFGSGVTVGENSQITMLGYIFDDASATDASAVTVVEGNIRAIDQQTTGGTGSIKFGLAKGDGTNMTVSDQAKMVVKLGTDVEGVANAQAFFIDLSQAKKGEPGGDVVYGDVNDDSAVDDFDLIDLGRYLAEWDGYTLVEYPAISTAGDVNNDGSVDDFDLIDLGRHLAEWDGYGTLPIE